MYEATLGTDWDRLDREEVLRRAYALGVAETLGSAPDGELERLQSQFSGRYDQSLVELAYDEGRTRGRTPDPTETAEEIWADLLSEGTTPVEVRGGAVATPQRPTDLPESITVPALLGRTEEALSRLNLPEFLR